MNATQLLRLATIAMVAAIHLTPAHGRDRTQEIADARALLREQWEKDINNMVEIYFAVRCGVFTDQLTADVAAARITEVMVHRQIRIGLVGDPDMVATVYAANARATANWKATPAFCAAYNARLQPADRAAIRQWIVALAR